MPTYLSMCVDTHTLTLTYVVGMHASVGCCSTDPYFSVVSESCNGWLLEKKKNKVKKKERKEKVENDTHTVSIPTYIHILRVTHFLSLSLTAYFVRKIPV